MARVHSSEIYPLSISSKFSNVFQLFKPLVVTLRCLGLILPSPNRGKQFDTQSRIRSCLQSFGWRNWIVFIVIHAYTFHILCQHVVHIFRSNVSELPDDVSAFFRILVTIVSVDHFFISQGTIFTVLESVIGNNGFQRDNDTASAKRKSWILTATGWLYIIVILTIIIATENSDVALDECFRKYFYGVNGTNLPVQVSNFICSFNWVVYTIVDTVSTFLVFVYICACFCIQIKVDQMNRLLRQCRNSAISSQQLRKIQGEHTFLFSQVKKMDLLYMHIVFVWYADFVHRLLFYIPSAIISMKKGFSLDNVVYAINILYYVYLFIVTSVTASGIVDTLEDGQVYLHQIITQSSGSDLRTVHQANTLANLINSSGIRLTGWNCFDIRRGIILTVFGGILTYVVLVMQIFPQT